MSGERDLRKRLAALERRVATIMMVGKAEKSEGAKTKVRFDDEGADGKPFSSPMLAQLNSAGKKGGGVSRFTKIGDGEPVIVFSPGGEMGEHSRVMPAGHVGDHPSPGAAEQDGEVMEYGDAKISVTSAGTLIKQGEDTVLLKKGGGIAMSSKNSVTVEGKDITLDGPVSMPKGFTAKAGQGSNVAGVIDGELHTTKDITSQTRVAAPILQGALTGA
jgi:phage baseplate assembly protein gpV